MSDDLDLDALEAQLSAVVESPYSLSPTMVRANAEDGLRLIAAARERDALRAENKRLAAAWHGAQGNLDALRDRIAGLLVKWQDGPGHYSVELVDGLETAADELETAVRDHLQVDA